MKILHIAPRAVYHDDWGYHENLLPKYHQVLGNDVTLITATRTYRDGKLTQTSAMDYIREDGVRVIRRPRKEYLLPVLTSLCGKLDVYGLLCDLRPDYIFFHCMNSSSILDVVRYKKRVNPRCVIVQDTHLDEGNYCFPPGAKGVAIRGFYRCLHKASLPYINRFYGVTPGRSAFAKASYLVPADRMELLPMGGDDDRIPLSDALAVRSSVRGAQGIRGQDFVVITGGKIGTAKGIHELVREGLDNYRTDLWLRMFGQPEEELREAFDQWKQYEQLHLIGWIPAPEVYDWFLASDLVVFPGTHSVLWEQACACGVPCLFRQWPGMEHVDVGGNCVFLPDGSAETLRRTILELYWNREKLAKMKKVAMDRGTRVFSYRQIAKRSLEPCKERL